jgi:hypothetical protein
MTKPLAERRNPPYLLRGFEKGKCKKKSWYEYIFGEIALGEKPRSSGRFAKH